MTFEEFFIKKKIDLIQFEKTDPSLFTEFKSHFTLMGEKSFDHTKKFWFNKLRRLYHLSTPTKAITQTETAIASQAEPLSSPTIEQQKPAFTPRFKSTNIPKAEVSAEESTPVAKPAFKPRNIPAKPSDTAAEAPSKQPPAEQNTTGSKPGFRPINIPVKAADEKTEESISDSNQEKADAPKTPGFKPRNIKPPAERDAIDANRADSRPGQSAVSETPIIDQQKQEEDTKQGYKPRFRMKNIPQNPATGEELTGQPVKQEIVPDTSPKPENEHELPGVESTIERNISSSTESKTPEQEIKDNDLDLRGSDDESPEAKPKPAYKPKFNLKNIKKSPDK